MLLFGVVLDVKITKCNYPHHSILLCHYVITVDIIWLVVIIVTPNETLTFFVFVVSASCWGSDVDLYTVEDTKHSDRVCDKAEMSPRKYLNEF